MDINDVKIMLYEKNNHIRIHFDRKLVSDPKTGYFRGEVVDLENAYFDKIDLMALCILSGVESLFINGDVIVLSVDVGFDWKNATARLYDIMADMAPHAEVRIQTGCRQRQDEKVQYDLFAIEAASRLSS